MTIQPTDLFLVSNNGSKKCEAQSLSSKTGNVLVNRGGASYRTTIAEIPTKVLDDDLMLINRGGVSFKVTGAEVKALFVSDKTVGTVAVSGSTSVYTNTNYTYTANVSGNNVDDLVYQWQSAGGAITSPNNAATNIYWSTTGAKTVSVNVTSPSAPDSANNSLSVNASVKPPSIGDYIPSEGGYWGGIINGQKIIVCTKNGGEGMYLWRTYGGGADETGVEVKDNGSVFTNAYKIYTSYPLAYYFFGSSVSNSVNAKAVGGKTDWYIPGLYELQAIQQYLNPVTTPYAAWKAGGAEAFSYGQHPNDPGQQLYYWTASTVEGPDASVAMMLMNTGQATPGQPDNAEYTPYVRAIRRGSSLTKSEEVLVEEANRLVRRSTAKAAVKAVVKTAVNKKKEELKEAMELTDEKESS